MANEFVARNGLIAQANSEITGSLKVTAGITGSFSGTASYADNANLLDGIDSTRFATTGSNTFRGDQIITGSIFLTGSLTSTGTITAQRLVVQSVTSSIVYSSGSNIFGNDINNTQVFTGSVLVTGSLSVNGSRVILSNQTSSMSASYAVNSTSASYALNTTSASYSVNATSASYAVNSTTASYASNADLLDGLNSTAFVLNSQTSSMSVLTAASASNITNAITNAADNRVLTANGGGTINGEANLTYNSTTLQISNEGTFNTTTPGTGLYGLHFTGQNTSDYANGLTWNGGSSGAQAGIYVQGSGAYGTRMFLGTTDAYASGTKTAISINETGLVTVTRNYLQSNTSLRAPIFYDSDNTAYYVDAASTSNLYTLTITGAANKYLYISPGNGYEAMVQYNGGAGSDWYAGKRMAAGINSTSDFHFYSVAVSADVFGISTGGTAIASGDMRAPIFYDSNDTTYFVNPNGTSNLVGLTVANTITGNITGNAGTSTTSTYVSSPDGDRIPNNKLPNGSPARSVQYDFANANTVTGATGNYAGVMTYRPWDGTSASTGDSSYQLAFCNFSGINASGLPGLALRNGINSTWNSTWYQVLHSGNYTSYTYTFDSLTSKASGTGTYTTTGDFRAPIFYDSNDTAYYIDAASTSYVSTIYGANIRTTNAFYLGTNNYYFNNTNDGWYSNVKVQSAADMRAPIFYDLDNTGYYINPNGTSNLLDVTINALGVGTAAPGTAGLIRATNDVVAYYSSDRRLKDNIKLIENPLEKILKIGGYEFDWNDKQEVYEGHDIGIIAQEIEEILPEIVTTRDSGYKAVKYEKIVPLLIEGIKEQQQQINELKELVNKLINK